MVVSSIDFLKRFLLGKVSCQHYVSSKISGKFDWLMKSKTLGPLVCSTDLQDGKDLEGPLM